MADPYLGEIRMAGYPFAPRNFAACDGSILPINQNAALFSLLGTTYGGNGVTTFALPDLRGRSPIHWGNGPAGTVTWGQVGGEAAHTLTVAEMPAHTHPVTGATAPVASQRGPAGNYYGRAQQGGGDSSVYAAGSPTGTLDPAAIGTNAGGQAHPNMQPYLAVMFYIATSGIFPSRS